jgi:hypothetical protein
MQKRREPRTLCTQMDTSTSPRGQALNPIQVGFLLIERECSAIPFTFLEKNGTSPVGRRGMVERLAFRLAGRGRPALHYLIDAAGLTAAEGSLL